METRGYVKVTAQSLQFKRLARGIMGGQNRQFVRGRRVSYLCGIFVFGLTKQRQEQNWWAVCEGVGVAVMKQDTKEK